MFKVNENFEVDRRILECDHIRYSPAETSTVKIPNSQIYINIPREDSLISLLISYSELVFEVIKKAHRSKYGDGNEIRFVNLRLTALFSNFRSTTSSGKDLEDNSHPHIVSLMYKLLISIRASDYLSVGFHRDRTIERDELARNKNINGKNHLRIMLRVVFGFAEHQEKTN